MIRRDGVAAGVGALVLSAAIAACGPGTPPHEPPVVLSPSTLPRWGTVDERFQSYNVEMLEVTGGKSRKPYGAELVAARLEEASAGDSSAAVAPDDTNADAVADRPPIDLANPRLRKLAAGLAPAYLRVSGVWANTTYFAGAGDAPPAPPEGFTDVLTGEQWKGVVDFSRAVDAKIVTSFAASAGTRDDAGAWTPVQARRLLDFTRSIGGSLAAAEFMNEPNLFAAVGAPAGYDAAAYGRDFRVFLSFVERDAPDLVVLGPGSAGESAGSGFLLESSPALATRDLLAACGPGVDAFSYHHYGTASRRCADLDVPATSPGEALSEEWLARTDSTLAYYASLRDELEPGRPIWLTETADAACGGNPWSSTFLDTFRYLDQLGRLAKQGVQVVAHGTLVANDSGLLDESTLEPRPNYWGALLWRHLMGSTVLDAGVPIREGLHVYAHSLRGTPGGVALLVINNDRDAPRSIELPAPAERYTLASDDLESRIVRLNGTELALGPGDELPALAGAPTGAGEVAFAPATITFLAVADAGNDACR